MNALVQLLSLVVLLVGLVLPAQPRLPGMLLGYRIQSLAVALLLLIIGIRASAAALLLAAAIVLAGQGLLLPVLLQRLAPSPPARARHPALLIAGLAAAILGIAAGGGYGLALGTVLPGLLALFAAAGKLSRLAGVAAAWNGVLLAAGLSPGLPFLPMICGAGIALLAATALHLLHAPAAPATPDTAPP